MLTPALMMIVFGWLTLRNVRQTYRRINVVQIANTSISVVPRTVASHLFTQQSTNITTGPNKQSSSLKVNRRVRSHDIHLITMLLVQVSDREKPKRSGSFSGCLFFIGCCLRHFVISHQCL
jgi:hypothetical protein